MQTITFDELAKDLRRYLDSPPNSEPIAVTDGDRQLALIVPCESGSGHADSERQRLLVFAAKHGWNIPTGKRSDVRRFEPLNTTGTPASQMISAGREDRT
jgi:hypothetical protein